MVDPHKLTKSGCEICQPIIFLTKLILTYPVFMTSLMISVQIQVFLFCRNMSHMYFPPCWICSGIANSVEIYGFHENLPAALSLRHSFVGKLEMKKLHLNLKFNLNW